MSLCKKRKKRLRCLVGKQKFIFMDMFLQTDKQRKMLRIYSCGYKISKNILPIQSSHIECVVLDNRITDIKH